MYVRKNNQVAVECFCKEAEDCVQNGEFCDSEEEARDWVEDECWIFSGENWICLECNTHLMRNLVKVRRDKEQEKKDEKNKPDEGDLFVGIPTVL